MKTTLITSKEALLPHRESILTLFSDSFGLALPAGIWDWAYMDNPHGDPVVALCHEGRALVGHYAIIPFPVTRAGKRVNSYLSMTTMIAPTHQGRGLFVSLARTVYDATAATGGACVMGFPNKNSAPGLFRRLDWIRPAPDRLARFSKPALMAFARQHPLFSADRFGVDMEEGVMRRWRLAKPGFAYEERDGLVYKPFGDALDLVWCGHERFLDALPDGRDLNVLVSGDYPLPPGITSKEYQFGVLPLAASIHPDAISRCMLLSDVF